MNTSSYDYEQTIEHQFGSFCKAVLRNHARNIYAEEKRKNQKLISIELLTQAQLNNLSTFDDYNSNYIFFDTRNLSIPFDDVIIAKALKGLSKKKQDIILFSFFLNMTNADIATIMDLAESTVHYHKLNALEEIKNFLEEHKDER